MPSLRDILPSWVSGWQADPHREPLVSMQSLAADAAGATLSLWQILPSWVTVRLLEPLASTALPEPPVVSEPSIEAEPDFELAAMPPFGSPSSSAR